MAPYPKGHVGAGDIPPGELDEYAVTAIDPRTEYPFADATPAPADDAADYCSCGWQRQTDGRCWRCDIGCSRCHSKLDREGFCSMCGGVTSAPRADRREAA